MNNAYGLLEVQEANLRVLKEIDRICEVEQLTGRVHASLSHVMIWPASHYVTAQPKMDHALATIRDELREALAGVDINGIVLNLSNEQFINLLINP